MFSAQSHGTASHQHPGRVPWALSPFFGKVPVGGVDQLVMASSKNKSDHGLSLAEDATPFPLDVPVAVHGDLTTNLSLVTAQSVQPLIIVGSDAPTFGGRCPSWIDLPGVLTNELNKKV